ncbi:hypothetical protein THRCLA_21983, partial [Thraustotheca clavata]
DSSRTDSKLDASSVLKHAVSQSALPKSGDDHDKLNDLINLIKTTSKISGKSKEHHLVSAIMQLGSELLDEKIELMKQSLYEAGVASHALYNSIFFIFLSVMFSALTMFFLALGLTQFLNTYLLLSYLDSLWITTSIALGLGIVVQ